VLDRVERPPFQMAVPFQHQHIAPPLHGWPRSARGSSVTPSVARRPAIDNEASRSYLARMHRVGLKILKNKLSEYVRLVADGETVVVTDRNRVVAEIVPPRRNDHESFIERGVREGWLRPAKRPFQPLPPRRPIPGHTLEQLLTDLDRDREDRW